MPDPRRKTLRLVRHPDVLPAAVELGEHDAVAHGLFDAAGNAVPGTITQVAAKLGVTLEPLTAELAAELRAADRLPHDAIDRAVANGGFFCRDRYSLFVRHDDDLG